MGKLIDKVGQRFGKLTVVERAEDYVSPQGRRNVRWKCACDCGVEVIVMGCSLATGDQQSCGCLLQEAYKKKLINLVGQRFGRLVVQKRGSNASNGSPRWVCLCDCSKEVEVRGDALRDGVTKSCGCLSIELSTKRLLDATIQENLSGQRFGRLVVINMVAITKSTKYSYANCICDCGKHKRVRASHLKDGTTVSCGCFQRENSSRIHKTHGGWQTKIYGVWRGMIDRCYNKNNIAYNRYGGRGIIICNEWLNSFEAFRDWAFKNGYFENCGLSIDRINVDGNYEPNNCRWATMSQQANNTSKTIYIEHNGKTLPLSEWSKITGISSQTIKNRVFKEKLPVEIALSKPVAKRGKKDIV